MFTKRIPYVAGPAPMDVLSVELPLGPTVGEGGGPLSREYRECYNMKHLSMTFLTENTLKCFDCVDLNVSQKVLLKEKGQSAEIKSQPRTRQVLARIGAAAAIRTLSVMLSHYRMFIDSLQRQSTKCDSKCKMRCILPVVSLPFRHKWYGATVDTRSLRSLCGETYQEGRRQEGVKKYWKNSSWVWRGGHAASATLDHLFLTSTWCEFYAAAVGLSSMLESSSGIIMLPPTRIASKCIQQGLSCSDCVIACLTSGYWCGRDGYWTVIQQHLNDMGIHLRYTYPIVFPYIPIVCHHIISYPFIQCSCHKYPWTKTPFLPIRWVRPSPKRFDCWSSPLLRQSPWHPESLWKLTVNVMY